jgi:hypothetical protein
MAVTSLLKKRFNLKNVFFVTYLLRLNLAKQGYPHKLNCQISSIFLSVYEFIKKGSVNCRL